MHTLHIDETWASQIEAIRAAISTVTPLLRPDETPYRLCRAGTGSFKLQIKPSHGRPGKVELVFRERDLYVTAIDGKAFVQYDKTLDSHRGSAESLNGAVMGLRKESGKKEFRWQSLIVMCVAESLRNDHVAARLGAYIQMLATGVGDALDHLPVAELLHEAHAWGQTSDAIFAALTPQARAAVLAQPGPGRHAAPLRLPAIDPDLQAWAPRIRVLKQPN